jgi:hypothetical protein
MIRRTLLVGPAAALALTTGVASAEAAGTPGWRTITTVSVLSQTGLFGVTTSGARHAWAVGIASSSDGSTNEPVVESWNGSAWSQVSLPASVVSTLGQTEPLLVTAAALGPANVWAFTPFGQWLHGSGTAWTAGKLGRGRVLLQSSLAAGKGTVWAFGGTETTSGMVPYASFHAGSQGWKRTPVPGTGAIAAASAVSGQDIWAVIGDGFLGFGGKVGGLVHWSGGHWHKVVSLPAALRNGSLGGVLARSDKNVWVGGAVRNSKKGTTEAVGHWNGHRWTVVKLRAVASAAHYHVASMVTDGVGGIWALGLCEGAKCANGTSSRLWHETAGHWSLPVKPKFSSKPHVLLSLAPAVHSVWGVGLVKTSTTGVAGLIALWGPIPH